MQLRSDSKRRTFVIFLAMCLLALTQVSAYAAGTQRIARASMAPVQSTIRSIRDQIQREAYSRHATASRHDARRSKR
jgi:hypothetical protein